MSYANVSSEGDSPMCKISNSKHCSKTESKHDEMSTVAAASPYENQLIELTNDTDTKNSGFNRNTIKQRNSLDRFPNEQVGNSKYKMMYEIEDVPSWYVTIFLAFQHYLLAAGSTMSVPMVLMPAMCMDINVDRDLGTIISTYLFVGGIVTILQTTFGTRLPIVQGGDFAYLVPALAVLHSDQWKCPATLPPLAEERTELWQKSMREIQGAIIFSSLFQIILGFCGVFGVIMKYITPITMASSVIVIGLSLFEAATYLCAKSWPISLTTIVLLIIFSQYLRDVKIPIPFTKSEERTALLQYPVFQLLPVLCSMITVWILCVILTASGVFPEGYAARSDIKWQTVANAHYFRVPYPFQWGMPTFTIGAAAGFLSAVFSGIVESLGDYQAVARMVKAPMPPAHSINRGVFIEGLGCLLCGLFGTGNGTTSYSGNAGAMSITKVGSRRVIQVAGFLMMVISLSGKIGALFVAIPDPIIGGVLCVTFAMITGVGISNLQKVDLESPRNIFVVGFSIFFSVASTRWVNQNKGQINFGFSKEFDYAVEIIFSVGMFVAALTSSILDNTIPGTPEERGLAKPESVDTKNQHEDEDSTEEVDVSNVTYDLPFGMKFLGSYAIASYFPISPTFRGFRLKSSK